MDDNRITYFAETDARNKRLRFGIKAKDRTRHVYVIGKTGMGKSTLLENMAVQDIMNGDGMAFIDPHGKTADLMLEYVPKERIRDVIYIAPFDLEYPISFNVLESVDPSKRHLVVGGLMSTFKKIWVDAWSARMEYILTNTLLALLEAPGSTLLGVNRMLSDKEYRKTIVDQVKDPSVKSFWVKEFANYTERQAAEAVPAIQNKVGQFTANPLIRNMIGQPTSSFDFREAMDKRKIIIVNLSKGKIGDENMKLLGGLLVTKIYLAAMSRADVPDRVMKMLPNFYLFVDEFQNFANASFADILSEARKYKLNLTIAHQYIDQMDEFVRPAVFGNVGTMITFRIGATDAEALENEFMPQFTVEDLVNLGFAQIYLKLMIDGLSSAPFSATTMPPIPHPDTSFVTDIIAASREQFAKPRAEVEVDIVKFHEPTPKASAAPGKAAGSVAPKSPVSAVPTPVAPKTLPSVVVAPKVEVKKPAPVVETHKPFANLKEVIETKSVATPTPAPQPTPAPVPKPIPPAPAAAVAPKPVEQAKSVAPQVPVSSPVSSAPIPAPVAPISLSSLAPKPQPSRQDPKAQSPKNVNDLKSALAAAMAKSAPVAALTKPAAPEAVPVVKTASVPAPSNPVPTASPVAAPIPSTSAVTAPNEVSKETLEKVLKVN